jgi:hypothetical protein
MNSTFDQFLQETPGGGLIPKKFRASFDYNDNKAVLNKNNYLMFPRECMSNMALFSAIYSQYKYISNANIPCIGAIIFNKELSMQTIYFVILIIYKQFSFIPSQEILTKTSDIIHKYHSKQIANMYEDSLYYSITRYRHKEYIPFPVPTYDSNGGGCPSAALPYLDQTRDIKFDIQNKQAFQNALRQAETLMPMADSGRRTLLFPQYSAGECDCSFEEYRQRAEMVRQLFLFQQRKDYERFLSDKAEQFRGKEVYFFGCGAAYTALKHIFADTLPKAILLSMDSAGEGGGETLPENVDGIPVCLLQEICVLEPLPVIIFCRAQHQAAVEEVLKTHLLSNKLENILFCLLNY